MATVTKDFKIKNGLIVEGTSGTINNYDILTKSTADQDYIIDLIGGSAVSEATPNTVVLRDANASFAANVITADLVGDVTGQVSDISNHDTDDLNEGSSNQYFTNARAQAAVAGDISSAIDALDTDDIEEGVTNLYFSNTRAIDATAASYDVLGAAAGVAGDLSTHEGLTSAHGVTGNIVGTSDTQDLSNKRFIDTTYFTDGVTVANEGQIAVLSPNHEFEIMANLGDLALKSYANDVVLTPGAGKNVLWGSDILATQDYADEAASNAVAALANSAPALLDTLNELAAAIGDDENFATTVANLVATKQNTLTEGTGIDITGNTISVDTVTIATVQYVDDMETDDVAEGTTNLYFTNARAQAAVAGDISSAIDALDTNDIEEGGTNLYFTNARAQAAVAGDISSAIDLIDTDAIEEGDVNLYYTNVRAKSDAAELLTTANLINISITGDENGLTIEAENGVADSTTDDLDEGISNLYFTNARAVSALQAVTPVFTEVDVNSVALQVASTLNVPTASTVTAYGFSTDYRSAKFLVKIASGAHTDISEVILTLDSTNNIAITEYAMVGTNGSLGTITADVNSGNVRILVATENNNSDVTVFGTLLI
jgi:hypothetical protein